MGVACYPWPDPPRRTRVAGRQGGGCWEGEELRGRAPRPGGSAKDAEFFVLRGLLRLDEVERILELAPKRLQRAIEEGGAMTPDSVDRLPNLWHFFMQHGRHCTGELEPLLRDIVEERIEPVARERFAGAAVACHCFLRRYLPEERRLLAAHFDHHAFATAVVGLNPEDFQGGLFVQGDALSPRAFVHLGKGDVLFHQYDLHHGVEVVSGSRYSLVFWLTDSWASCVHGTVPWYRRAAEEGDADAQHLWASCLASGEHSGRGGPDLEAAVPWFERAVAQRNVEAMNAYAALLWEHPSVKQPARALDLWREASDMGYAKARGNLGGILCTGAAAHGSKDVKEGLRLLRSASKLGDVDAMLKLASHLRRAGDTKALRWMQRCAETGHPDACMMLAEVHIAGDLGAERDDAAVLRYARWAAQMGHAGAATLLGGFHARGDHGAQVDLPRAVRLWRRAAAHDDADALFNLALCHARGEGGAERCARRALHLCERAASRSHAGALRLQSELRHAASAEASAFGAGACGVCGACGAAGAETTRTAWERVD